MPLGLDTFTGASCCVVQSSLDMMVTDDVPLARAGSGSEGKTFFGFKYQNIRITEQKVTISSQRASAK